MTVTSAALICVTGLGLGISSPAFAVAPTVSLTAPAANARYGAPAAITLTATATNTGDTISKVEFYQGATLLGTATTAPYSYNWSNVTTGSYSLTAKATNSHNETKTSTAVAVVVNNAPTVSITAPANNSSVAGKASITLTANATDADGTISKVEFYNGTTLLNSDTAAPYSYSWANVAPGTYSITAKATDNLSGTTTSTPVSITVTNPITVNLTAPANNASVTVGAPIAITATAADSKGTISKVEFYNGTTLLGSATASPYSYSWTNAAIGTYSLTAKVTDSQSLTQTSTAVSVQVKAAATTPPTVSLTPALKQATQTAPANGTFVAPAGISLAATATPASGSTIAKVEFYQGATLIGTATAPTVTNGTSYSVNWSNVTANSYNVTAKATDNKNATATTAPVTVNVINNSAPTVSLTANPANGTAPATIILNATATDTDGTITQVEFLNGTNSIATVTQAPYTTNWANVAQGSYSLTAKATDNLGASTTSAAVPVAVTANTPKAYDIHADHLNTPRVITDNTGIEVWRWDSAPFGEMLPNEQPQNNANKFVFNQRFPGQYYDVETNLHYNYFRDYDPATGRYIESDPIGLNGGINTFGYVGTDPLGGQDPFGLSKEGVDFIFKQMKRIYPDIKPRGDLSLGPILDENVAAVTNRWNGNITVPNEFGGADCLRRSVWEDLFFTLFHEGMHSSDDFWDRGKSSNDVGKSTHHQSIYNRESLERNGTKKYPAGPVWGTPRATRVTKKDMDTLYKQYTTDSPDCKCTKK